MYQQLRDKVLALSSEDLKLTPSDQLPHVWGLLMELGFPKGAATLVVMANSDTSLYMQGGSGIIGGRLNPSVRQANRLMLLVAEKALAGLSPIDTFPLPKAGRVRFYVFTYSGRLGAEASEEELEKTAHPLSKLFLVGHGVIAELRKAAEKASAGNK